MVTANKLKRPFPIAETQFPIPNSINPRLPFPIFPLLHIFLLSRVPDFCVSVINTAVEMEGTELEMVMSSRSVKLKHDEDGGASADRLSELPESLIYQILSLLDMKYAVRTSLLSKRWKNMWKNVDCITYHHDLEEATTEQLEEFISFVGRTLPQCTCPKIKSFSVSWSVDNISYESFNELDEWLEFVVDRNVESVHMGLKLRGCDGYYPDCFCESTSISDLKISHRYVCMYFNMTSLKTLSLKSVRVQDDDLMNGTLSGCPLLETIVLDEIKGMKTINITSKNVKTLKLLNFQFDDWDFDDELEHQAPREDLTLKITAPWLQELEILGKFVGVEYQLLDLSSLKKANIVFWYSMVDPDLLSYPSAETLDYYLAMEVFFAANPDVLWLNMANCILNPVSHVEELVIGSELIQALSLLELLDRPSTTFMCKRLVVHTMFSDHEIPGILRLLKSSANLETLVIKMTPFHSHFPPQYVEALCFKKVHQLIQQEINIVGLRHVTVDFSEYLKYGDGDDKDKKYFIIAHLEIFKYMFWSSPAGDKFVILPSELDYLVSDADDNYDNTNHDDGVEEVKDEMYYKRLGQKFGSAYFGKYFVATPLQNLVVVKP